MYLNFVFAFRVASISLDSYVILFRPVKVLDIFPSYAFKIWIYYFCVFEFVSNCCVPLHLLGSTSRVSSDGVLIACF